MTYEINANELELECIQHVEMAESAIFALQVAKNSLDKLLARHDRYKRMADSVVRKNPKDHGLLKSTESGIAKAVEGHPNVVKSASEVLAAKLSVREYEAQVNVLDIRRRMLEQLIKLHGSGYFVDVPIKPSYNSNDEQTRPLR